MAKHTAIRLENSLMLAAKNAAVIHKRTAVEQIEYWAELGRNVSRFVDPDTLIACSSGLAVLKVEQVNAVPLNPADVFKQLDAQREAGVLAQKVKKSTYQYQASEDYPGLLERVDEKGNVSVGTFKNGTFKENKDLFN